MSEWGREYRQQRLTADGVNLLELARSVEEELPIKDQHEESIETIRKALQSAYLLGVTAGRNIPQW